MSRESVAAIMRGVDVRQGVRPKRVYNNTVRYLRPDGVECIRLHHTDIVLKHPDGCCELHTGGWRTVTTKARLNAYSPARVYSERGQWYVAGVPFFDGIRVDRNGVVLNGGKKADREAKRVEKLAASINAFCKRLDKLKALPAPELGDCFICQACKERPGVLRFNSIEGQSGPEGFGGSDHLLSHIKEGYLHGSLIMNALAWAGYRDPGFIWAMDAEDVKRGRKPEHVKRALRRYLRRKLGVG